MMAAFLSVLLPLTTFVALGVQVCPDNFFGENCMYQCKCVPPCNVNGTCATNKCQSNFFGPMCQFYDGVNAYNNVLTEAFLRDNNEKTCNPNASAIDVKVLLSIAIQFLWFRIYVSKNNELVDFSVKLNQTEDCFNMRNFSQDNFVDVTCDNSLHGVNELLVGGPIAGKVCSLYISLGRNAALKQTTYQSTTMNNASLTLSKNAVDGSVLLNYFNGSCSHTQLEANPEWILTYNRLQILLFVEIWKRDTVNNRLKGFKFEGLSESNSTTALMVTTYYNSSVYRSSLFSRLLTRYLRIRGALHNFTAKGILALCEVQAYSETVCPPGTFGLWCQSTCSCQKNEICNSIIGDCAPGCPAGFYGLAGFGCSMRCVNCKNDLCDQRSGQCDKCIPGYKEENCSLACYPGFYGQDCAFQCSQGCEDMCDAVNGTCSCQENFAPPECKECDSGFYGQNCTFQCSQGCEDMYDAVNGTCSCQINFAPPDCKECDSGFYGQNCTFQCSQGCENMCNAVNGTCSCQKNFAPPDCIKCTKKYFGPNCNAHCSAQCKNGLCSYVDGNCLTCKDGYSGLQCESTSHDDDGLFTEIDNSSLHLVIPAILTLLIVSLLILFCVSYESDEKFHDSDPRAYIHQASFEQIESVA